MSLQGLLIGLCLGLAACSATRALPVQKAVAAQGDVRVALDSLGIPTIQAATREQAYFALGYLMARDRLFQMDLLRRRMAGRLAELFGSDLIESDVQQRTYGFEQAARASLEKMNARELAAIEAYASGVNEYLAVDRELPLEFGVLEYRPEPWRAEDSVLVVLSMFQGLGGTEEQERTRTVLARTLPRRVYRFLTASTDRFTRELLGNELAPEPELPTKEFEQLVASGSWTGETMLAATAGEARRGSNAWAIAGSRTRDGRAILANDMHLDLAVPNVWYRAALRYADVSLDGVFLPGVPVLIAGTNHHVAWGLTSLEADVLDLVNIEQDAAPPNSYRTPGGFRQFATRKERISVRGAKPVEIEVRSTIWGPVTREPLLGKAVAVRWSALDGAAVGIELIELDRVRSVDQAVRVLTQARGPATNVLLADEYGDIAWTVTGRIPQRQGFDGATSVSWADGKNRWLGYVAPDLLPRVRTPHGGMIVNANQRVAIGRELVLSHDYANGSRALRIAERLASRTGLVEQDLFAVQLDAQATFFNLYRDVVLSAASAIPKSEGVLSRALAAVARWDGKAEPSSVGLALLVRFRKRLAEVFLSPLLARCKQVEPSFEYSLDFDAALERVLSERVPELLPPGAKSWDAFVLGVLEEAARELEAEHPERPVHELPWGEQNRVRVQHPLGALPELEFLNMPAEPLPGCGFCVRVASGALGATERFVVSPGREADGIFHMPGGQSGNPSSPNYSDQQRAWLEGLSTPLLAGPAQTTLTLTPSTRSADDN